MRLLLVEDEKLLSSYIVKGLSNSGYAVDAVYDGEEALFEYSVNEYDLIILDLNLPGKDGLTVLREIRERDNTIKIIILSARSTVDDRILGLDDGANDYLVKPFDFGELEARIRNLLRQNFSQEPVVMTCGALKIDTNAKRVMCGEVEIILTRKEYGILEYLMFHKGKVVSAEEIIEHVWNDELDPFSNTLRYHIHSLKKKLNTTADMDYIKTIHGLGYRLEDAK